MGAGKKYVQLVVSCTILGVGVAFLLEATLGSDGYSSLVNGITIASSLPFWVINILVGAVFIAMAWLRGIRPGPGTLVQWFLVGFVISAGLTALPTFESMAARVASLAVAFVLIAAGVAGYLASNTGAGPAEGAALAWDPPLPFKWTYSILQGGGALVGWLLGAAIGPGTIVIIFLLGPVIDLIRRTFPSLERTV